MKKEVWLPLGLGLLMAGAVFSTYAYELTHIEQDRSGYYIGLDYWPYIDAEYPSTGDTSDSDANGSSSVYLGIDTKVIDSFYVGIELAYSLLGDDSKLFKDSDRIHIQEHKGSAVLLRVKPKYYIADSDFYIAGIAGIGQFKTSLTAKGYDSSDDYSFSDTSTGYQLGVEAGYEFDSGLGLSLGYKNSFTEVSYNNSEPIDLEYKALFVSAKYKF